MRNNYGLWWLFMSFSLFLGTHSLVAQSANLLNNSNFETGSVTGWTPVPNLNNSDYWGWNFYQAPYNYFAVLNNVGVVGDYRVYQDVMNQIQEGQPYTLSGVAATSASVGGTAQIFLEYYDNANLLIGSSTRIDISNDFQVTGFQAFAPLVVSLPTGTIRVRVVGYANGRALQFDNMMLTKCNSDALTVCRGGSVVMGIPKDLLQNPTAFQWQYSTNQTDWFNIAGATADTLVSPPLTQTTYFRTLITQQPSCGVITTSVAQITVVDDPSVSVVISNAEVCVGGDIVLSATTTGGTGTCLLQWQSSTNGTTWTNINGAHTPNYTVSGVNQSMKFRAVITCSGAGCCN